jgi:hypothetical protein
MNGETSRLGSDVVLAESFGPEYRLRGSTGRASCRGRRSRGPFSHRVRVYTRRGSATYNVDSDYFEEVSGDVEELTKVVRDVASGLAH